MSARTKEEVEKVCTENGIPDYMVDGIVNYIMIGQRPGSFLQAIFENDLMMSAFRADGTNVNLLLGYCRLLYNDLPSNCWGNREVVMRWIENGGLRGIA